MTEPSTVVPWITTFASVLGLVVVAGFRRGPMVSPMAISLLLLGAIFGVRPILMVAEGDYRFYGGSNVSAGFAAATWVGLLSVLFLLGGYLVGSATRRPILVGEIRLNAVREPSITRAAVVSVGLLLLWIGLMATIGGGPAYLALLFAGRGAGAEASLAGVPAIIPALPVVAGIFIAIARIRVARCRAVRRGENLLYWVVVVLTIIPPTALGSRRFLLPSLIAAILGAVAQSWYRRVPMKMAVLGAAGFLALTAIPFVRSSGSRAVNRNFLEALADYFGEEGLSGSIRNFFLSYDTEMFSYIAYLAPRLGDQIPFGLGRGTVGEALLLLVPSSLFGNDRWSNVILIELFGGACGPSYCPVPSVSGVLFYDFALPGVVAGMVGLGFVLSRFEHAFLSATGVRLTLLLTLASFVPQVVRGNPVAQLWIAAQIIVVLVFLEWLVDRVSRSTSLEASSGSGRRRDRQLDSRQSEGGLQHG